MKWEERENSYLIYLDVFLYFNVKYLLCNQKHKTIAIIFALRTFSPLSNIMYKFHFKGIQTDFHANTHLGKNVFSPTSHQKLDNTGHKKLVVEHFSLISMPETRISNIRRALLIAPTVSLMECRIWHQKTTLFQWQFGNVAMSLEISIKLVECQKK